MICTVGTSTLGSRDVDDYISSSKIESLKEKNGLSLKRMGKFSNL